MIELLADVPDLFDVKMDSSPTDCAASRFTAEGSHEPVVDFVKSMTDEAGGGRRPLHLARHAWCRRSGAASSISSAARGRRSPIPSCRRRSPRAARTKSANASAATSASRAGMTACRCAARRTRRRARNGAAAGIPSASSARRAPSAVLIVGGGPAGLECALTLGRRGYEVDARRQRARELGGRLTFEATLPGLAAWHRVVDYRLGRAARDGAMSRSIRESRLDAPTTIIELRRRSRGDGDRARAGRATALSPRRESRSAELDRCQRSITPDDIAAGANIRGPDRRLRLRQLLHGRRAHREAGRAGHARSRYVTAGRSVLAAWTIMTNELPLVHRALTRRRRAGDDAASLSRSTAGTRDAVRTIFTGEESRVACRSVLVVGHRLPRRRALR